MYKKKIIFIYENECVAYKWLIKIKSYDFGVANSHLQLHVPLCKCSTKEIALLIPVEAVWTTAQFRDNWQICQPIP